MSHQVAHALYGISPTARGVGRASDLIFGLASPVPAPAGSKAMVVAAPASEPLKTKLIKFAPHAVGLGVGAFVFRKKFPIRGALIGHALLNSGYEYYKGDKKQALCEAAVEGAALIGSFYLFGGKSPLKGWLVGAIAGAAATYFVADSPVQKAVKKFRGK